MYELEEENTALKSEIEEAMDKLNEARYKPVEDPETNIFRNRLIQLEEENEQLASRIETNDREANNKLKIEMRELRLQVQQDKELITNYKRQIEKLQQDVREQTETLQANINREIQANRNDIQGIRRPTRTDSQPIDRRTQAMIPIPQVENNERVTVANAKPSNSQLLTELKDKLKKNRELKGLLALSRVEMNRLGDRLSNTTKELDFKEQDIQSLREKISIYNEKLKSSKQETTEQREITENLRREVAEQKQLAQNLASKIESIRTSGVQQNSHHSVKMDESDHENSQKILQIKEEMQAIIDSKERTIIEKDRIILNMKQKQGKPAITQLNQAEKKIDIQIETQLQALRDKEIELEKKEKELSTRTKKLSKLEQEASKLQMRENEINTKEKELEQREKDIQEKSNNRKQQIEIVRPSHVDKKEILQAKHSEPQSSENQALSYQYESCHESEIAKRTLHGSNSDIWRDSIDDSCANIPQNDRTGLGPGHLMSKNLGVGSNIISHSESNQIPTNNVISEKKQVKNVDEASIVPRPKQLTATRNPFGNSPSKQVVLKNPEGKAPMPKHLKTDKIKGHVNKEERKLEDLEKRDDAISPTLKVKRGHHQNKPKTNKHLIDESMKNEWNENVEPNLIRGKRVRPNPTNSDLYYVKEKEPEIISNYIRPTQTQRYQDERCPCCEKPSNKCIQIMAGDDSRPQRVVQRIESRSSYREDSSHLNAGFLNRNIPAHHVISTNIEYYSPSESIYKNIVAPRSQLSTPNHMRDTYLYEQPVVYQNGYQIYDDFAYREEEDPYRVSSNQNYSPYN